VDLSHESESFALLQWLGAGLLCFDGRSCHSVYWLKAGPNSSKSQECVYDFCNPGFQSCRCGLWSKVNFLRPLRAVQSRIPATLSTSESHNA
jgi:hypothetical protein